MIPKLKNRTSKIVNLSSTNGFTFVELLVVVTIIVLLSAIGLASYSQVNKKARDGKRKSDLEQIRAALEIYRSDQGVYPVDGSITCGGSLQQGASVYMNPIPCDPKTGDAYAYSRPTTTTYTLGATLEVDTPTDYSVKQP